MQTNAAVETDKLTDRQETEICTYHATNARHITGVVMVHREVLHQRVLTRLTAIDWETNNYKHGRLQTRTDRHTDKHTDRETDTDKDSVARPKIRGKNTKDGGKGKRTYFSSERSPWISPVTTT